MPDEVQVWCTPLDYPKVFQLLVRLILMMSWQKKPCWASHKSAMPCACAPDPHGGFTSTPRKLCEEHQSTASLNLLYICLVTKWRWQHRNCTNCTNPELPNWKVGTQKVQEQQSQMPEMPVPPNPTSHIKELLIQYIAWYSKCQMMCRLGAHLWNFPRYSGHW